MTKIIRFIGLLLRTISLPSSAKFKLEPMEVLKDEVSNEPYVILTVIGRYRPHKISLEDLLEQPTILKKLDFDSLCYVFHSYGIIRASNNNNAYSLIEIQPFNQTILVKNLQTISKEIWTIGYFEKNYFLLDKQSLYYCTQFFSTIKKSNIQDNLKISNNKGTISNLRLVK